MHFPYSIAIVAFGTLGKAWYLTIYEGTSSCDAKDDTRYRIYDGDASNVCQPFGKAESGDAGSNTCMEYTNGGTEYGDCTDETWTAKSMLVEKEADIYSCFSYENDSCEGDGRAVASQGEGDSGKSDYVCTENDNGFKSFKCVLANDTESVEEGVNWRAKQCDDDPFWDASSDPVEQWDKSGAEQAWFQMISQWKNSSSAEDPDNISNENGQELNNFVANYFHAPLYPNCHHSEGLQCIDKLGCQDSEINGGSPAGYIIQNSMHNLRHDFHLIQQGFKNAEIDIGGEVSHFQRNFKPAPDNVAYQRVLTSILLGYAFGSAASFNTLFKRYGAFAKNPNAADTAQEMTNGLVSFAVGYEKDEVNAVPSFGLQNGIQEFQTELIKTWGRMLNDTIVGIFAPEDNWTPLYDAISGGKLFGNREEVDLDVAGTCKQLLYAATVPAVWSPYGAEGAAVVITTEGLEKDDSKSGCDAWKAPALDDDDLSTATRFCDGEDAYWLISFKAKEVDTGHWSSVACKRQEQDDSPQHEKRVPPGGAASSVYCPGTSFQVKYSMPDGMELLNGTKTAYGGLKWESLGKNSVKSWKANDKTNGWKSPDIIADQDMDYVKADSIDELTGFVNIPVCSFDEVTKNGKATPQNDGIYNPAWPCDNDHADD